MVCARISIEGIKSQEGFKPVITFVRSGRYQPGFCLKRMAISSALDFTAALLLISTEK